MLSALTKIVFGFIFSIFIFVFQRFLPSSSSWIVNVESKFVISNYWEIQEVMMTMMMVLISLMNERTAIKLNEKKFFVQNPALTSAREMRTKIEKYGTFAKKKTEIFLYENIALCFEVFLQFLIISHTSST